MYYLSFALSYTFEFCSLYLESSQYDTSSTSKYHVIPNPPTVASSFPSRSVLSKSSIP